MRHPSVVRLAPEGSLCKVNWPKRKNFGHLKKRRHDVTTYVKSTSVSTGRKEVDRVDDCHRDNSILGAEIEITYAIDNLL